MPIACLVAAALALAPEYCKVLRIAREHAALSNPSKHSWQGSEQKQTHGKTHAWKGRAK